MWPPRNLANVYFFGFTTPTIFSNQMSTMNHLYSANAIMNLLSIGAAIKDTMGSLNS